MLPTEFEPTIPASEQPQSQALDRAITEIAWHIPLQAESIYSKIKYILRNFP